MSRTLELKLRVDVDKLRELAESLKDRGPSSFSPGR